MLPSVVLVGLEVFQPLVPVVFLLGEEEEQLRPGLPQQERMDMDMDMDMPVALALVVVVVAITASWESRPVPLLGCTNLFKDRVEV